MAAVEVMAAAWGIEGVCGKNVMRLTEVRILDVVNVGYGQNSGENSVVKMLT